MKMMCRPRTRCVLAWCESNLWVMGRVKAMSMRGYRAEREGGPGAHRLVGVAGFEPAASCSQGTRANQAALHPVSNNV